MNYDPVETVIDMWDRIDEDRDTPHFHPVKDKQGNTCAWRCEICSRTWRNGHHVTCVCEWN